MSNLEESKIVEIAESVIHRLIYNKDTGSHGLLNIEKWEWGQGVGLYSIYKFYKITGKKEYLDYLINWYDSMLTKEFPIRNVNTTAPLLTLIGIYEETGEERYFQIIKEWAEWIMNEMPRTKENGIQHITSHIVNNQQLWDDTLFMTVLFLAKAGKLLNREDMIQDAIYQFMIHIKYLVDRKSGLWFHGWSFEEKHHFGEALWGRGNCWYTSSVVELLEILDVTNAEREILVNALIAQIDTLSQLQRESGMWGTLLDDETSYDEASGTAGFAYGILKAIRMELISKEYSSIAKKAVDAILSNIGVDGTVLNVSHGTPLGNTLDDYRNIPICPTTFGQALTILMLIEVLIENRK